MIYRIILGLLLAAFLIKCVVRITNGQNILNAGMFAGMGHVKPSRFASIAVPVTVVVLAVLLFLWNLPH